MVKFFGLLRKDCPDKQVAYYQVRLLVLPSRLPGVIFIIIQAGIGTYFAPGVVSPLWTWLASLLDEAFAWYVHPRSVEFIIHNVHMYRYLDAHVMGGYKYLMDNYRAGDKICIFGN